jgi:HPt (histidine-containing phosphotransfer) domain-containing protein
VIINLTYLQEITGGDDEMMVEMINLFLEDIPSYLKMMEKHYQVGEFTQIGMQAHKLKPTLQYAGLSQMVELIKEVESIGKSGEQTDKIPDLLEALNKQKEQAIPALEKKKEEILSN